MRSPLTVVALTTLIVAGCASPPIDHRQARARTETCGPPPVANAPPVGWDAIRMVFFDSEKANLSAEAQSVIGEIVSWRKQPELAGCNFYIEGHSDAAERDPEALSARRAEAVRREVLRLGMPADIVEVRSVGRGDPLIQTPRGVREQQNRRVVISYH